MFVISAFQSKEGIFFDRAELLDGRRGFVPSGGGPEALSKGGTEMEIVREQDIEELRLPGRSMKWFFSPQKRNAENLSVCAIRVPAGETVRPAHSHPNGEEVIYIIKGKGRIMVDGEVNTVQEGTGVLFPPGSVHMLKNTGNEEMKVICFFSPPSDVTTYKTFEDIPFPE